MAKQKKYEIYNVVTGEVLAWGYNDFIAMCNMVSLKSQYGDVIDIRWV